MPDYYKFLDLSALFVAIVSILFGLWHPFINNLIETSKPPQYRNRRSYIAAYQSAILSKSVPLTSFLLMYGFSLSGVFFITVAASSFTLRPGIIRPAPTIFCLTYLLTIYLLAVSAIQLLRLIHGWWAAGSDRPSGTARITLLR